MEVAAGRMEAVGPALSCGFGRPCTITYENNCSSFPSVTNSFAAGQESELAGARDRKSWRRWRSGWPSGSCRTCTA